MVVAVDIGGTTIKTALADRTGVLDGRVDLPVAGLGTPDDVVTAIVDAAASAAARGQARGRHVRAVGLAVPGLVDAAAGVGRSSMLLGWRDVPFAALVATATGLPVGFVHDVEAGALAEGRLGAAAGLRDWLFLAVGTGLGSTFILDGRSYRGATGTGGTRTRRRSTRRSTVPLRQAGLPRDARLGLRDRRPVAGRVDGSRTTTGRTARRRPGRCCRGPRR